MLALIGVLALFNIWWFVFVVGVLISIFLHETGHFVTSRWTGMKATQFFIGFGPRLWSFRKGETEYGVRALPLGAFVRIIGMNNMDDVPPEDESRTYRSKSYPRRMLVISAGSLMHMLIAIVLLFTVYAIDGETKPTDGVQVQQVLVASPAAAAGTARRRRARGHRRPEARRSPRTSGRSSRPAGRVTRSMSSPSATAPASCCRS